MPDIFVSIDTTFSSKYLGKLSRRGILSRFSLDYVDRHREEIESDYTNVQDFKDGFEVDDDILEQLYAYAMENEVEAGEEDYSNSIPRIKNWVKGLIARNIWKISAYYNVVNDLNPIYIEALETIRDKRLYKKLKIAYND